MQQRLILSIFFLSYILNCLGQQNLGQYSYISQLNVIDAKTVARGGVNIAAFDPIISDKIQNPALLISPDTQNLFVNYSPFIGIYNSYAMGFAYNSEDKKHNNFTLGLKIFDFGPINSFDRNGNALIKRALQDYKLSIGTMFGNTGKSNINLGVKMNWLGSYWIDDWRAAITFDVGTFYQNKKENVNLALLIKGVGFGLKEFDNSNTKASLPIDIQFESAFKLEYAPFIIRFAIIDMAQLGQYDKNLIGLGVEKARENNFASKLSQHIIMGLDFIPKKLLTLHFSYGFRHREFQIANKTGLSGISFGGTLKLEKIEITYAKQMFGSYGSSNHINLAYKI